MPYSLIITVSATLVFLNGCGQATTSGMQAPTVTPGTITIRVGKAPGCVEVADFNKDRHPDLVVTSEQDSSVTILLGKGKGAFEEAKGSPFPAGHIINDVAIGDFNNDSSPDLALANHEKKYLTVLSGNGQGGFTPAPGSPFRVESTPHVHGIAMGDFDKDGNLDLVTESWGNNQVVLLLGEGRNGFKSPGRFFKVGKMPYQRLRAADVNIDGNMDIVTTNLEGNNVTVLLGDGGGNFNEAKGSPFPCGAAPFSVAIGDVNADGRPDLAIVNSPASTGGASSGTNGLTVLTGDGTGRFTTMQGSSFAAGKIPNRVAIGDVNGDGVNDIVTSDSDTNDLYVFLADKKGNTLQRQVVKAGNHPKGIAIADLDGDGKGEIVVCNNLDDTISIIRGQ